MPVPDRPVDPVIATARRRSRQRRRRLPSPSAAAVAAPHPAEAKPPAEKTAHLLPPPPPPRSAGSQSNLLDDNQISGLRAACDLLRIRPNTGPRSRRRCANVARMQLRGTKHAVGGKVNIDTNSPEVQKLIWAAMPLLMRLTDDQKGEVRKLARVIGLDQVASQI